MNKEISEMERHFVEQAYSHALAEFAEELAMIEGTFSIEFDGVETVVENRGRFWNIAVRRPNSDELEEFETHQRKLKKQ